MRATRRVVRSAAGVFAIAVVVTAWRASAPPSYRAVARIEIPEDAATSTSQEVAGLEAKAVPVGAAVHRVEGTSVLELSALATDPAAAAETINGIVDDYLRSEQAARGRRAATMLGDTTAAVIEQTARVRRVERQLADAQTLVARVRRDRQAAAAHLRNVERSIARAHEKLAELEPLVAHIKSGQPAESLSVVQNTLIVQGLRARLAVLSRDRVALLGRYGPSHPKAQQSASEIAAVTELLQTEVANVVGWVTDDYETARRDKQWLEGERDKALLLSTQPMPSRAEYAWLHRGAEAERAALSALVLRQKELAAVFRNPGSGVTRIERAVPVPETFQGRAPWIWALGLLMPVGLGLFASAAIRHAAVRRRSEKFPTVRETPRAQVAPPRPIAQNIKKIA